jgi:hypothetical protein
MYQISWRYSSVDAKFIVTTEPIYAVAQFVDALRYKLYGRGFDSRGGHWDFS